MRPSMGEVVKMLKGSVARNQHTAKAKDGVYGGRLRQLMYTKA